MRMGWEELLVFPGSKKDSVDTGEQKFIVGSVYPVVIRWSYKEHRHFCSKLGFVGC